MGKYLFVLFLIIIVLSIFFGVVRIEKHTLKDKGDYMVTCWMEKIKVFDFSVYNRTQCFEG